MGTDAVKKKPQYSDLPEGADIVHDPGTQQQSAFSDLPQGASIVPSATPQPEAGWRGVLSRMRDTVKAIPHALNPMETESDKAQGVPSLDLTGSGMPLPIAGPMTQPLLRMFHGQSQAEQQLAPQVVQQYKDAELSHTSNPQDSILQQMWKAGPSLEDVRVATTGLSMLNPFASSSVANVNSLHDSGQGNKATEQGIGDALMLGSSFGVNPAISAAGKFRGVLSKVGSAAKTAATAVDPDLVGLISPRLAHGQAYLGKVANVANKFSTPAAELSSTPIQDALQSGAPSVTMHDVPNFSVNQTPATPVNLLDKPAPMQTGLQGEFPVNPPRGITQYSAQDMHDAGLTRPMDTPGRTLNPVRLPESRENLIQPGTAGNGIDAPIRTRPTLHEQAANGDWVAQGMIDARENAFRTQHAPPLSEAFTTPSGAYRPRGRGFGFSSAARNSPATKALSAAGDAELAARNAVQSAPEIISPERPLNLTDSGNKQVSNLAKNRKQMGWDKPVGTVEGGFNSPPEAQAALEQAAQQLFGKSYNDLSLAERLQTLSPGAKLQDVSRGRR